MSATKNHSATKIYQKRAKNILLYSKKVLKYRKHLMSSDTFAEIEYHRQALRTAVRTKQCSQIEDIITELDQLLRENGGDIYPVSELNDTIEVLLVASIIALAIRAFFVQTFQIPTNSMYPTYHGVNTQLRTQPVTAPWQKRMFNRIFNWSYSFDIVAEHTGSIEIPLFLHPGNDSGSSGIVKFKNSPKGNIRIYSVMIGKNAQQIQLPAHLTIDSAFLQRFGNGARSWQELYIQHPEKFRITADTIFFKPGCSIKAGENFINFDIICGDMLFVNKLPYHFRHPRVGEPVVFRTEKIKNIPGDPHYFIKRLIGQPGDKIQLRNEKLFRNAQIIRGSNIFEKENKQTDGYPGYTASGSLTNKNIVTVPQDSYFVLGDNSPDSGDSRFWGFVPQTEVKGKPLFIFYPLNRAGFCK